jgi:hypothetical protein
MRPAVTALIVAFGAAAVLARPAPAADAAPDAGAPRPRNDAGEELPETLTVAVGRHAELRLGWICIEARCDDTSVVRVEDGGDHLRLVGLAEGKTRCGFWKERSPAPHRLIEVVVVPAKKPPPRRDGGSR